MRSSGSLVIRPSRTPGREAAHETNRAVASRRYGATNPAATMPRTLPAVGYPEQVTAGLAPSTADPWGLACRDASGLRRTELPSEPAPVRAGARRGRRRGDRHR